MFNTNRYTNIIILIILLYYLPTVNEKCLELFYFFNFVFFSFIIIYFISYFLLIYYNM